jgi:phosphoribosyl 1,2-cyclic phosphate phosphodiesterase
MKLKYYGTAAAEGFPGMFCACPACEKAKAAGGRNIRTRTQAMLDGKLLIDFPPDTYMHVLYGGLDLRGVASCLITHGHSDHLYPWDFEMKKPSFAYTADGGEQPLMRVYSAAMNIEAIKEVSPWIAKNKEAFDLITVLPFVPFQTEGYTITGLRADHSQSSDPLIYSIDDGEKAMLYAHDTGWFPKETWDYLAKEKPFFNFVSLDCTGGIENYRNGHMGLSVCADMRDKFMELGLSDENTLFCVHHFSHNGKLTYDELVPVAGKLGFLVSYDGMEVTF